jgi:6-phosphogluconolactonase/glucosamine-6-phosphate isomerase/deaminase
LFFFFFFFFFCEDAVANCALDYESAITKFFGSAEKANFDLVLLGLGPDGHTGSFGFSRLSSFLFFVFLFQHVSTLHTMLASLFPNHTLLKEQTRLIAPIVDSPKPPPLRITFTLRLINAAHAVAFIATGDSKQSVLKQIVEDAHCTLPGALVRNQCTHWFVDRAAVKGIDFAAQKL